MLPEMVIWGLLPMIPFMIMEQLGRDEFPSTGLGPEFPAPRSLWSAQLDPLRAAARTVMGRRAAPLGAGND